MKLYPKIMSLPGLDEGVCIQNYPDEIPPANNLVVHNVLIQSGLGLAHATKIAIKRQSPFGPRLGRSKVALGSHIRRK